MFNLLRIPFSLLTLYKEWVNRNVDRVFKGSNLPITGQGSWTKAKDLPSYRYEFGAATASDKIYVIGGVTAPTVYTITKKVEAFDLKTKSWSRVANHPHIIHHSGVTSDGKNLYVIGGNGLRITPLSIAHVYKPEENRWYQLKDMPTRRGAHGLVYSHGKIYAVGGADNKRPLDTFEAFDPKTNEWETLPSMPTNREHLYAVVHGDRIYALGGYQNDRFHNVSNNEAYDLKTNKWYKLAPLPANVSGMSAAVWGDSIFVFGGEQGWAVSGEVYEYQIKKDRWLRCPDLPLARYASAAAVGQDGMHVLGGNPRMMSDHFSYNHEIYLPQ